MIDKKGKLFGIINIIDLAVLLLIVLIVGAVGFRLLGTEKNGVGIGKKTEYKEVYVHVKARLKDEELAKEFKKGDKLVEKNTYNSGVIESVSYKDGEYTVESEDGNLNLTTHPIWKDIDIVVKQKVDVSGPTISLGGQEIRVGGDFWVKTQTAQVQAKILAIDIK
ncbi:MAG: DUF4330 domain-containing protein [Firmicutes bacterium]|nr:DUF4330 domain-containing protein [Bacillota bacterium]